MTMKTFHEMILRISVFLVCVLSLFLVTISDSGAVVVAADSIRSAVQNALNQAIEREGLEIETSVPFINNVLVKGVEDAVIRPVLPIDKINKSRVPVKVELLA